MDQYRIRLRSGALPYQEKLLLSKARFPGALAPETALFYIRGSLIPGFMANALKHGGLPANFLATSCGKPR